VQAVVVPVADRHDGYGAQIVAELVGRGVRAELDDSDDTMGAKIRKHQIAKVPYQLIVGDDEMAARTLSVRPRVGKQQRDVSIDQFARDLLGEVQQRGAVE
jgi:threonyl-tRNA synthetase